MRNKSMIRLAALGMATLMAFSPVNASAASLLKKGSSGSDVRIVQSTLKNLGYYTYSKTTGYYGSITVAAVKRFQKDNRLSADGIIGKATMGILIGLTEVKSEPMAVTEAAITLPSSDLLPEYCGDLDWFKQVKDIWVRGEVATVTDVNTGKSFQVKRTYGSNHADVEPLTQGDTQIIKEIWGGFSWERRAVVVQLGKYTIAASMTAMPHAGLESAQAGKYVSGRSAGYGSGYNLDSVKNNGCSGVMDIHFKNSRTHTTNTVQKSQQNMVQKAEIYIKSLINKG